MQTPESPVVPDGGLPTDVIVDALRGASTALFAAGEALDTLRDAHKLLLAEDAHLAALTGGKPTVAEARLAARTMERVTVMIKGAIAKIEKATNAPQ